MFENVKNITEGALFTHLTSEYPLSRVSLAQAVDSAGAPRDLSAEEKAHLANSDRQMAKVTSIFGDQNRGAFVQLGKWNSAKNEFIIGSDTNQHRIVLPEKHNVSEFGLVWVSVTRKNDKKPVIITDDTVSDEIKTTAENCFYVANSDYTQYRGTVNLENMIYDPIAKALDAKRRARLDITKAEADVELTKAETLVVKTKMEVLGQLDAKEAAALLFA